MPTLEWIGKEKVPIIQIERLILKLYLTKNCSKTLSNVIKCCLINFSNNKIKKLLQKRSNVPKLGHLTDAIFSEILYYIIYDVSGHIYYATIYLHDRFAISRLSERGDNLF